MLKTEGLAWLGSVLFPILKRGQSGKDIGIMNCVEQVMDGSEDVKSGRINLPSYRMTVTGGGQGQRSGSFAYPVVIVFLILS